MLIEILRRAARDVPGQPIVVSSSGALTYADCLSRSEALARGLLSRSLGRFGCVVNDTGNLLALLAASSAVGSEACIYPRGAEAAEIDRLAVRFEHATVVTDGEIALDLVAAVHLDGLPTAEGGLPPTPERAPVLILTTGTTGEPKGTRHDWSRLIAAVRHPDERPGARWLLTYNLNQFAGVQMLLHAVVSHATLVVPSSNQPREAIALLREMGVTHVSATPTFWRLAVGILDKRAANDLGLQQITLGGESVPQQLLDKLRALFPYARISQVYAGSEFGSALSIRDGRSGLPLSLLERGEDADVRFRIVDGELYIRSRAGMLGYHGGEQETEGWRPTGDLVEVRGDRVHFVGRSSDVINVGGVKVHPIPVENVVGSVEGVELARAYGRPNPITGQIVAVDVVANLSADMERLEADIRAACESLPAAARPRRIRFVSDLEVRGHKLSRRVASADQ